MFVFCNSQDKKKNHIHNFMETVILNESYDINNINEFMNIDKDSLEKNTKTYELIQFYKEYLRSEITKNKIEDFEILIEPPYRYCAEAQSFIGLNDIGY